MMSTTNELLDKALDCCFDNAMERYRETNEWRYHTSIQADFAAELDSVLFPADLGFISSSLSSIHSNWEVVCRRMYKCGFRDSLKLVLECFT